MITISDNSRISESLGAAPKNKRQAREYALIHALDAIGKNGIVEAYIVTMHGAHPGSYVWTVTYTEVANANTSSNDISICDIDFAELIATILGVHTERVLIKAGFSTGMIPTSSRGVHRLLTRIKLQLGLTNDRWRVMLVDL
jgi:hypothetical protein